MNMYAFPFHGETLYALPSGALHWPARGLLCVSDLHLGKSERRARLTGALLPPYEVAETLDRLESAVDATRPETVICLGDSFDDITAADTLDAAATRRLARLQAGRDWIWIEGNHDPGPVTLPGRHLSHLRLGPLSFRHIATPGAVAELSGHYHPKHGLPGIGGARPCFLLDRDRLILPAFGAYTGGLRASDPALAGLMRPGALALLTGRSVIPVPLSV
ncbi:MAG: putative phosphoesterase [Rhodobacteraceae bacterium HLUCCA08]|nr:MAG: putative phosphoesterase [Rhodobacteraceae bacterium HLUCCA08]